MARNLPETIETRHFRARCSPMHMGYVCDFTRGRCGRRGQSIFRDFDFDRGALPMLVPPPKDWSLMVDPINGGTLPRCDTCTGLAADAVAEQLIAPRSIL